MNKKGIFITLAVAVVIAAVAYIAGSVNKDNDKVAAENANLNINSKVVYSDIELPGTNLIISLPNAYTVCKASDQFFPGLKAYAKKNEPCDPSVNDAPDIQIYVFDYSATVTNDGFLRQQGDVFFTINPDASITQEGTIAHSTLAGTFIGVRENAEKGYRVYVQSNIGPVDDANGTTPADDALHLLQNLN